MSRASFADSLVDTIARKMGIETVDRKELEEIEQDVSPEAVLDGLDAAHVESCGSVPVCSQLMAA